MTEDNVKRRERDLGEALVENDQGRLEQPFLRCSAESPNGFAYWHGVPLSQHQPKPPLCVQKEVAGFPKRFLGMFFP